MYFAQSTVRWNLVPTYALFLFYFVLAATELPKIQVRLTTTVPLKIDTVELQIYSTYFLACD